EIIDSVRDVLGLEHRPPRPLRDTAPRLNAFRAVAGNGPAARVADVNDPSEDGNRRVERSIAADGSVIETPDETSSHVDGEHAAPDGRVDMRDLRRFRDAWLQRCLAESDGCPPAGEIELDGAETHPKRDLNFDGCVTDCGAREHRFSRFDFNGNRVIDTDAQSLVPWKADGTAAQGRADAERMSDVGVLQAAWTGGDGAEGWTKDDVPSLLRSADVEVHADAVLDAGAARAEVQVREKDGAAIGPERTLRRRDGFAVLTVPLDATSQELELVTTATTDHGATTSVSPPFSLRYGEDRLVAVCPDLSLKASPQRLPAGGGSTSVVTVTVGKCHGREDVAGKAVSFELEPAGGGAQLEAMAPETDAEGRAQAVFTPGEDGTYTVKVSVAVEDGADPLEAELEIEVVPLVTIRYAWRQTIEEWKESGSTRWQPFDPALPDCTLPGFEYCIDDFEVGLESQTLGGVLRTGTLTGGGEQFELSETVANSAATSRASWSLSFPDGDTEDGGVLNQWFVTDPDAYTDHPVSGLRADDEAGGLRLRGLQAVGDLPYHYALFGQSTGGTVQPVEVPAAKNAYLLIPQGGRKIRFAAQPDEAVVFARTDDGFGQFQSCGRVEEDLQTQKGYYVGGPSDYIPGATEVSRKATYAPGDRPMPVGPGNLKVRYAFAATVAYAGQPVPEPVLPECTEQNPPQADFTFTPADGQTAREGRQVAFQDRSTDPENDIVERTWEFGDGGTGSGAAPHHLFQDDGTFTVTLTVEDAEGNTDTATKQVEVANEPPEASIDDATGGTDKLRITYRMLDPGHVDKQQLRYELTSGNPDFPTRQGTEHAGVWYVEYGGLPAGTYPLTLKVTDKDGESDTDHAVAVVTAESPPPPPPPVPGTFPTCDPTVTLDAEEREFLLLVNDYRADNGLPPVGVSATLTRAADRHAGDMAAEDFMEHTGSDGSSPADRAWDAGYPRTAAVGENLAESETASDALWAWRGSSTGHNENMLNPAWTAIGISRVEGSLWRWATSYGTVQDCPGATPAQQRSARSFAPTPTEGGVEPRAAEVEAGPADAQPQPRRLARSARLAAPADAGHPPTPAIALADAEPTAGKPATFTNRSRDAAGYPIAARVRFGDSDDDPQVELPPDGERTHAYPDDDWWDSYELQLEATDGEGRSGELSRWVEVEPVWPPSLYIRPSQQ
ncbi:MAG TPA: PKD domain-containing protein, partial [Solirubrobacter sp.]|nr:PKD domain-containing protein [Solirubrobacter sp.]